MSSFCKFILAARQRAGLSTRELERLSGVSKAYISQMETGGRNVPTPDILRKLAPHLKVSYEDLMKAAGYIDIPAEPKYAQLKAVSLTDEYAAKGLSEADIRRILDGVLDVLNKPKDE